MSTQMGERIAKLLRDKNLPQQELAGRIGVTKATVSRYLSGEREPKPETLANIATALHTTSDYLLGIEKEGEYSHIHIKRIIARNADQMTAAEKRELIAALLGDE